ncbi:MAG: hypothetical protein WC559_03085 [Candidatus Omnitrophota bacterium]
MKQLLAILITALIIIFAWVFVRFLYSPRNRAQIVDEIMSSKRIRLSNRELEEELTFFLASKLGIYEGSFEIVDIVNLKTYEMAGADYLLVTVRTPDGKLCQVVVSRKAGAWGKWEIQQGTFRLIKAAGEKGAAVYSEKKKFWMKELGVTADELRQYYRAHPEAILKGDDLFFDEETGIAHLPADWFKTVKPEISYKLSVDKNGPARFVPEMQAKPADAFWQPDYPADYLGGGYRSYLYEKIKESK